MTKGEMSSLVQSFLALSPLMQLLSVATLTTLIVQVIRWILWYKKYYKFFNSLPGETSFHPIWGNLHMLRGKQPEERLKYINGLMLKYPKFFRLWVGPFRVHISLYHPDCLRELLKSSGIGGIVVIRGKSSEERIRYGNSLMEKYPKFCRFWRGPFQSVMVLYHADTVRNILKTSEPKPRMYYFALPWLGTGLLLANGDRWARSRRLLTPAFHFDILKPYVTISNQAAEVLMDKISAYAESKQSFEVFSHISLCTLDVILQCAMSSDEGVQRVGETHPYVQAVSEMSDLWFERGRNPFLYSNFVYQLTVNGQKFMKHCDFVHSVSEKVIQDRKMTLEQGTPLIKRHRDFLDILLTAKDDMGKGLTDMEIRNEVDTFLFEGHDTTASAISWILYSLAQHPDVQRKAQDEIDSILRMKPKASDRIEWADLTRMDYMTQVIKEGMRLHCPVPFVQRLLTKETTIEGVTLPVGTECTVHLLNLHHNPAVWEDPWTFNPDRFNADKHQDRDMYAFVPFSAGPRNCIGQHFAMNEEKVILGRLLRQFTFMVDESHKVSRKVAAVMRAENGIKLFAIPRRVKK